ncbi:MAG: peptidoglycan editing factor PgeF [Caulobacteraceae bacterium]|nr:peptidoglycan editing factor PgeF [Caulobacteraceae bacterium]
MSLQPLQSSLLAAAPGVRHAFFTRQGGVSKGLYRALNVGAGSKDDPAAVAENRALAAAWFDAPPEALTTVYQVHSATAHVAARPWPAPPEGDAVVSMAPGLICGALAADCAPVLIADAEARVVAAAHAGWRGALGGVVASAVEAMAGLGADPARMVAAVGPCIGPASYEVGLDFLGAFIRTDPKFERFFMPGAAPDKRQFDLAAFVLHRLAEAGVTHAEWIGRDTCAEADLFFSNRRAFKTGDADYGRLLSAVMLEP